MADPMTPPVEIPLTPEERAVLARRFGVDDAGLADAVARHVRHLAAAQLRWERKEAKYRAAEKAGQLYVARYWQHYAQKEERFLTAQEAADFLRDGVDYEWFAAEGVFAPDGDDLGWSYEGGWPEGSPYRAT